MLKFLTIISLPLPFHPVVKLKPVDMGYRSLIHRICISSVCVCVIIVVELQYFTIKTDHIDELIMWLQWECRQPDSEEKRCKLKIYHFCSHMKFFSPFFLIASIFT